MTNDLQRRVQQHQSKQVPGFTSRYNVSRLMHYEVFNSVTEVIARETKIKGRNRLKKEQLIEEHNPYWEELASTLNK